MPMVEAAINRKPWPRSVAGLVALLWQALWQWWSGLYLGWGVTTSLAMHVGVAAVLAVTYFSIQDERGMLVTGEFNEARDGDKFDDNLDSRLDTSFGDKAASLEFVATNATSPLEVMASPDNLLGGLEGASDEVGDSAASMAQNVRVPQSAVTQGSFTVWTEPENPTPRVPYDIIIQVKLPNAARQYRLNDLSGVVTGTDGFRKVIRYQSNDRKGVKDGVVQVSIRIPGAAQLVRDVIQIKSRLLKEEQTIEIIFGQSTSS